MDLQQPRQQELAAAAAHAAGKSQGQRLRCAESHRSTPSSQLQCPNPALAADRCTETLRCICRASRATVCGRTRRDSQRSRRTCRRSTWTRSMIPRGLTRPDQLPNWFGVVGTFVWRISLLQWWLHVQCKQMHSVLVIAACSRLLLDIVAMHIPVPEFCMASVQAVVPKMRLAHSA